MFLLVSSLTNTEVDGLALSSHSCWADTVRAATSKQVHYSHNFPRLGPVEYRELNTNPNSRRNPTHNLEV